MMEARIASTELMNGGVKRTPAIGPRVTDAHRSVTVRQRVTLVLVAPALSCSPMGHPARILTSVNNTNVTSVTTSA